MDADALRAHLAEAPALRAEGRVLGVTGLTLRLALPGVRVGDVVLLERRGEPLPAEIVGFDRGEAIAVALGELVGVGPDDPVQSTGGPLEVRTGPALLGRVLDGLGRALDNRPLPAGLTSAPVDRASPPALARRPVTQPLATGIRAIDGLMTLGVGQRIGLFSGSGVGKSTLLGAMARGTSAEVVVVALVGERGREVGEFLEHALGSEGLKKSLVVAATADAPALERLRAAQVATAHAEAFRDAGHNVLLLVDSLTRVARAQREVGLAAGEPPARRGYPPSVYALLPRLLERSGQAERGSISAVYAVLVEGDDMDEPIADEVRAVLDGHIVLDRSLAASGHYPAIGVNASLSRVMSRIVSVEHARAAQRLRQLLSVYESKQDLIALGAYAPGSDERVDQAIRAHPEVARFLQQDATELSSFDETLLALTALANKYR